MVEFTNEEQERMQQIAWNIVRHRYYHKTKCDPKPLLEMLIRVYIKVFAEEELEAFARTLHNEAVTLHSPIHEDATTLLDSLTIDEQKRNIIAMTYYLQEAYKKGYIIGKCARIKIQRLSYEGDCTLEEAKQFHLFTCCRLTVWLSKTIRKN